MPDKKRIQNNRKYEGASSVGVIFIYFFAFVAILGFIYIGSYLAGQMSSYNEELDQSWDGYKPRYADDSKDGTGKGAPDNVYQNKRVTIQPEDNVSNIVKGSDRVKHYQADGRPMISYEESIHPEEDIILETQNIEDMNSGGTKRSFTDINTPVTDQFAAKGIGTVGDLFHSSKNNSKGMNIDETIGQEKASPLGKKSDQPSWLAFAQVKPREELDKKTPFIAIVIDDLGVDYRRSLEVINMKERLTLAFLPYANNVEQLSNNAYARGHEILVHVPMEPQDLSHNNPGPNALLLKNTPSENLRRLRINISRVPKAVGINNHMGSALTKDGATMTLVMGELKRLGMLFLDSRTTAGTVAQKIAKIGMMPNATRDIFLDHDPSIEAVMKQLNKTLRVAQNNGHAVAIGHPKDSTIHALKQWLPTVKNMGIKIVPLTTIIKRNLGKDIDLYNKKVVSENEKLPTPENAKSTAIELSQIDPAAGSNNDTDEGLSDIARQLKALDTHPNIIVDYVGE